jgi:threonine/homoserine/homoserine lactone efflux protein
MNIEALLALVIATAVLGMVPGPVVGALVGRALLGGVRSTFGFLGGVFMGDLLWLLAAVSGLGYLAAAYATVFMVIKYLGALYLIYLGYKAIRHALDKNQEIIIPKSAKKGIGFFSGLFVTLGNPKLVAFYVGFLPTFINMETLSFQEALIASILVPSTFAVMNFGWALSASKAKSLFKSAIPLRALNFVSGGLLVGAGFFMLAEDQP